MKLSKWKTLKIQKINLNDFKNIVFFLNELICLKMLKTQKNAGNLAVFREPSAGS